MIKLENTWELQQVLNDLNSAKLPMTYSSSPLSVESMMLPNTEFLLVSMVGWNKGQGAICLISILMSVAVTDVLSEHAQLNLGLYQEWKPLIIQLFIQLYLNSGLSCNLCDCMFKLLNSQSMLKPFKLYGLSWRFHRCLTFNFLQHLRHGLEWNNLSVT